jgi:hypothetical protein
MITIGIDPHKSSLTAVALDEVPRAGVQRSPLNGPGNGAPGSAPSVGGRDRTMDRYSVSCSTVRPAARAAAIGVGPCRNDIAAGGGRSVGRS